jgi:hypothetical protein
VGILFEDRPGVRLWFESYRVNEDIATDATAEQLLNPGEVPGDHRADAFTVGVHHVDDHYLVFDEVIIEPRPPAFVCCQDDVGKVQLPDPLARSYISGFGIIPGCPRQNPVGERLFLRSKQISPINFRHDLISPAENRFESSV